MENLYISATPSSPEVDFRFTENVLSLRGESYPENAAAFYSGIISSLNEYLDGEVRPQAITLNVELTYFNSSSTKMLFTLFGTLNDRAADGADVTVNWYRHEDDDTMREFGQDLQDDFSAMKFHEHAIADD
ncbi:MAG: Fe-S oxidoreductase [Burkholderiaceae bacterium]|nr:Fe-S oxidoreductase [Burkholderiaceae bacterium]